MNEPRTTGKTTKRLLLRAVLFVGFLVLFALLERAGLIDPIGSPAPTPQPPASQPTATAPARPVASPSATKHVDPLVVRDLTLRDQDGRTIYQGNIDLRPTLERIAADRKLRFSHDGTTFQNREGRLPREAAGHYREWVVPTPGEDGPGPQRIVTGDDDVVWYTADHYRTFRRLVVPSWKPPSP